MPEYKVIGNHAVAGVEPGGTVDLDDSVNVDALVAGGHIEPVSGASNAKSAAVDAANNDEENA